jgi:hypothetical protein
MTENSPAAYEDPTSVEKDKLLYLENCESTQLHLLEVSNYIFD